MDRTRLIAATLARLVAALPGCTSITFRARLGGTSALHVGAADDAAVHALAEALGTGPVTVDRHASRTQTWLSSARSDDDLYVLVTGPASPIKPVDDTELDAACRAVRETSS
jgi:hypothetical protein